ncbi:MAG: TadG family pilus assembly protein, partial [Myxococcota bacterium]
MPIRARTPAREGNIATIVALGAVVLLSFAALTIDLGYGRLVQQQLENASEAGARAGSLRLDGTEAGLTAARVTAASMAAQNFAGGGTVVLADDDIVLGVWDATAGTFTPSSDPLQVNTVQVRARIDELALHAYPVFYYSGSQAAPRSR